MSKYGLIGKNIKCSSSPFLHEIIGNYEYELIDIQNESEIEAVLKDESFDGFNVTIPYKKTVIKYLDEIKPRAEAANAVNTIKRVNGKLIGYNTDVHGFKEAVGNRCRGRKCMIFGTGGAARAAAVGLREYEAGEILFVSRDPAAAKVLLPEDAHIISYDEVEKQYDTQVIINATPIGNPDTIEQSPLGEANTSMRAFAALELAVDLIYQPYRTKFLQDARRLTGCKTSSGLEMLIHQAIGSRNIWMGDKDIPIFEKLATSKIKRKLLSRQLNIVAIGMPGCGKTSIFRRFAQETNRKFIDVDHLAEEMMGKTIEEVLYKGGEGEEYFREIESKAVLAACKNSGTVIATGGGAVLNPINRDLMKANGIVVYVRRPASMLSIKGRPISRYVGVDELFEQRDKIYQKVADISIPNTENFGNSIDKNGGKNSFGYDMKAYVFHVKAIIDKYIFDIAGNKWI